MAVEDFSNAAYIEADPGTDIDKGATTSTKVSWVNLQSRYLTSYVYKDFGADHFGTTFKHRFEFQLSSVDTYSLMGFWMLSNSIGDYRDFDAGVTEEFVVFYLYNAGAGNTVGLRVYGNGAVVDEGSFSASESTTYFVEIERTSGTSYTITVWTGSYEGAEVWTDTIVATASSTYRYYHAVTSYDTGDNSSAYCDGFTQNVDLAVSGSSPSASKSSSVSSSLSASPSRSSSPSASISSSLSSSLSASPSRSSSPSASISSSPSASISSSLSSSLSASPSRSSSPSASISSSPSSSISSSPSASISSSISSSLSASPSRSSSPSASISASKSSSVSGSPSASLSSSPSSSLSASVSASVSSSPSSSPGLVVMSVKHTVRDIESYIETLQTETRPAGANIVHAGS